MRVRASAIPIVSRAHSIARFFAALALILLSGTFAYQMAEGMGWLNGDVQRTYYPPPDGRVPGWVWVDEDEPQLQPQAPTHKHVDPAARGARVAVDVNER